MNLHLFTTIILYLFVIIIIHVIIKNNITTGILVNKNVDNSMNKNVVNSTQKSVNSLENINDFDETSIRNELLSYLNIENKEHNEEMNNFLEKTDNIPIKGSNYFTSKSVFNFEDKNNDIDKNFNKINNDVNSFDPVINNENTDIFASTNNKVFGDIEAFDDFDETYASI